MFTRFAAWCNISNTLEDGIISMGLSSTLFMIVVMAVFLFLGFFIDLPPLLLIGIPLVFPIAEVIGIDPIWFCVIAVIVINLGALTPPVGINLFVLKGVDRTMPISKIYAGALPFVASTIVAVAILFVVKGLTTWLPQVLK
jgi:TRAP-type C4-dicarboxylate transport system permease large subunit